MKEQLVTTAKKKCGGSVALQQALFSLKILSQREIAKIIGNSHKAVWQNTHGVFGCTKWADRIGKADLQEIAKQLLEDLRKAGEIINFKEVK